MSLQRIRPALKILDMQTIDNNTISAQAPDGTACRFGVLVGSVFRQWRKKVDDSFKQHGLTDATRMPLVVLYDHGRPMLQKEIAQALSLDSSSLVRVLGHLRSVQLVQWACDPQDKRTKRIALTVQGQALAQQIVQKSLRIEQALLAGLTPQELAVTRQSLQMIAARFEAIDDNL